MNCTRRSPFAESTRDVVVGMSLCVAVHLSIDDWLDCMRARENKILCFCRGWLLFCLLLSHFTVIISLSSSPRRDSAPLFLHIRIIFFYSLLLFVLQLELYTLNLNRTVRKIFDETNERQNPILLNWIIYFYGFLPFVRSQKKLPSNCGWMGKMRPFANVAVSVGDGVFVIHALTNTDSRHTLACAV